ncbi:hypothetical protein VE03_01125 [Pseudogymnoascus sp. 23342-1-I1]|nr:hypothetical protein VE03_01125 [Pseudogymnoascus sp. 23342-1-I1]
MVGLGWLRGAAKSDPVTSPKTPADELKQLEHALAGVIWIMADDVDAADKALHEETSSFHYLGRGVTQFLRSVLGFEQDVMKEASDRLAAAEASSWADLKRAQKDHKSYQSRLYSPGAEYALCYAESQMMSAVIGVLNESLTESIKGFYKLRKAYFTLDSIMREEAAFMRKQRGEESTSSNGERPRRISMPGSFDEGEFADSRDVSQTSLASKDTETVKKQSPDDSDLEFLDAEESKVGTETPTNYLGHTISNEEFERKANGSASTKMDEKEGELLPTATAASAKSKAPSHNAPEADFFANPMDLFIHSGTNLCYGLVLLIISMVPPAFNKLLYIIGFQGDRARGIRLLWQATKFDNINGAIAGLVLLSYFNAVVGFCDIVLTDEDTTEDDPIAFSMTKCNDLIDTMKSRYPTSRLWRLEEARKEATNRNLKSAIKILNSNQDSKTKQIMALNMFEKSLCSMSLHEYELCTESFVECTTLNNWSHPLYVFSAGAAQVELYRKHRISNPEVAKKHKDRATALLKKAPTLTGKRRFMAKQLPFDIYVARKVQKWEEREKAWKVDLVDAIGVSPLEEIIYLWNGYKRMQPEGLQASLQVLDWSNATYPEKFKADMDEIGLQSLMQGAVLRYLGKFTEARQLLTENIVSRDKNVFKGHLYDDWNCPSAYYEMAVISWMERGLPGNDSKAKLEECEEWLNKVAKWETAYVLDARIGMKVTTGLDTIKRCRSSV